MTVCLLCHTSVSLHVVCVSLFTSPSLQSFCAPLHTRARAHTPHPIIPALNNCDAAAPSRALQCTFTQHAAVKLPLRPVSYLARPFLCPPSSARFGSVRPRIPAALIRCGHRSGRDLVRAEAPTDRWRDSSSAVFSSSRFCLLRTLRRVPPPELRRAAASSSPDCGRQSSDARCGRGSTLRRGPR